MGSTTARKPYRVNSSATKPTQRTFFKPTFFKPTCSRFNPSLLIPSTPRPTISQPTFSRSHKCFSHRYNHRKARQCKISYARRCLATVVAHWRMVSTDSAFGYATSFCVLHIPFFDTSQFEPRSKGTHIIFLHHIILWTHMLTNLKIKSTLALSHYSILTIPSAESVKSMAWSSIWTLITMYPLELWQVCIVPLILFSFRIEYATSSAWWLRH